MSGRGLAGAMCALAAFGTLSAQSQTYTVLHRFTGPDGLIPEGGLIVDPAGNLFGTTLHGGASGYGTVFKLDKTGLTVLYSFAGNGTDGAYPYSALVRDLAGDLYGTTGSGGESGYGTVFKIDAAGAETVLHSFGGGHDGKFPYGLLQDAAGGLYGTTWQGGRSDRGTVFKLDNTGGKVLSFSTILEGTWPYAALIQDSAGNLYGTTTYGGQVGLGNVFKLDAAGAETVLYSFTGGPDGGGPYAGLIRDAEGNLYGTTAFGGATGSGTVFKLDTAGTLTVLHTFTGGADGYNPYAGLIQDSAGNLYGTTTYGGSASKTSGYGVVFKIDPAGTETVLYTFTGRDDGGQPFAGLFRDSAGNLYGTASSGGKFNSGCSGGCGVVFKIAP